MSPTARGGSAVAVEVEGRTVQLSNLDKVLWPEAGLSKRWLLSYYADVTGTILPHLEERPLTLHRFPDGVDGSHWYQTRAPAHPPWVRTISLHYPRTGKTFDACVVSDAATLLWAANLGAIELHPFLSRTEALDRPTALVFDLDPGWPATIVDCSRVALRIRDLLVELALAPLVKTSGAKGLHLYVPLDGSHTYEQTKAFAHTVAKAAARELPELVVDRMALAVRAGRVFIDWTQNDPGKSTVVAYSLRAGGAPTISTPVLWEEVERCQSSGRPGTLVFTADDVRARIKEVGDIFRAAAEPGTRLPMLDS